MLVEYLQYFGKMHDTHDCPSQKGAEEGHPPEELLVDPFVVVVVEDVDVDVDVDGLVLVLVVVVVVVDELLHTHVYLLKSKT